MSLTIYEKLTVIQSELKVGKNLVNKFGGYNFRNTESIFEALKPFLSKHKLHLLLQEDMVVLGNSERFYKKITATISDGTASVSSTSYTREDEMQKGLTHSQLSGAVGSYGAKMALRGLLLLDDTNDDDATNDHGKGEKIVVEDKKPVVLPKQEVKEKPQATTSFRRKMVDDGI